MRRGFTGVLAIGMAIAFCGCGSEQSKLERGIDVDEDAAAPQSERVMEMTEAEREAADLLEDETEDAEAFDAAEQR